MVGRGLVVEEPRGERWDLAIDLLTSGESGVLIGPLGLSRNVHGPRATGRLRVAIVASRDPGATTLAAATDDIRSGLDQYAALLADERFAALVAAHGVDREYIHDYGMGSVRLATIEADGSVTWDERFHPSA